jgi:GTPase SAR1 family protein
LKKHKKDNIILVGNKTDLKNKVVDTTEGEEFANKYNFGFLETSAKNSTNVDNLFLEIAKKSVEGIENESLKLDKESESEENKIIIKNTNDDNKSQGYCNGYLYFF